MDIESLYYFSELSKSLNMTHTANRLYISQQTLSNHIQRLENFYGTPLFYRKPKLSLTSAGTEVLKFADMVIINHQNLKVKCYTNVVTVVANKI
ncbi:LysR family transcriptional regulator [[Ruminococcus] lactaris]|uniref:LysR family transcriptional regulator n=1 Tax=[Ruminococcus] lactaris TaxID=46228 RepID=UPI00307975C1